MFYFAYGSNLWLKQMEERCPGHRDRGHGVLKGYRWIITARGYANVVSSGPDEVHGRVYELTESDVRSLDRHEGVDSGCYRKELLTVEVADSKLPCLVYVDPVEEEGVPREEYVERINRGISDSALPPEYVARYVRRFVPAAGGSRSTRSCNEPARKAGAEE
jgi:gamma-glutamylcyclotransferase (GGCT)/AIG2-like uncharacterized protein YtfP